MKKAGACSKQCQKAVHMLLVERAQHVAEFYFISELK